MIMQTLNLHSRVELPDSPPIYTAYAKQDRMILSHV